MLFNKNQYRQTGDEKVLHKVGKQWKVISVALLMAVAGGAVATHAANADTTNVNNDAVAERAMTNKGMLGATRQSTQSNASQQSGTANSLYGVSPRTLSICSSLAVPPKANQPVFRNRASSASSNTNQNSSASSNVNNVIQYQSGDNGSAASYHNKAMSESNAYNHDENEIANTTNSVNTQYPERVSNLSRNVQTAQSTQNADKSLAASYANVAHQSNYNANVSSVASTKGLTVSGYIAEVQLNHNLNSYDVSVASGDAKRMNQINSYAQLINSANANPAQAKMNSVSASDNATLALAKFNDAKVILGALNRRNANVARHNASYMNASVADRIALINSGVDSLYANSLAHRLGYVNQNGINNTIFSTAQNFKSNQTNSAVDFANARGLNRTFSTHDGNLYRLLSDVNAMDTFASARADNYEATGSAQAVVNSTSSAYASATSVARVDSILANHPTMASIFGTFHKGYGSIMRNANAKRHSAEDVMTALNAQARKDNKAGNTTKLAKDNRAIAKYSSSHRNILDDNLLANSVKQALINNGNVNASDEYTDGLIADNNDVIDLEQASNAVSNMNASQVNSLTESVNSDLANNQLASTEYDNSADVNYVLAGNLASSYANDSTADSANVSVASANLQNFYNNIAGSQYASVANNANNEKTAYNKDNALGNAYGVHVYNYGPKFIRTGQKAYLFHSIDHTNSKPIGYFKPNTDLTVLGVGFTKDGSVRYLVNYRNHQGYVDSNEVTNTYLYANKNNHVTVVVTKPTCIYRSSNFHRNNRVDRVQVGTKLSGTVMSKDGIYGGFTRLQLDDGDWITSNTHYVQLDNENNQAPKKNSAKQSLVNFWN